MVAAIRQIEPDAGINAKSASDTGIKAPRFRIMHKFWLDVTTTADDTIDAMIHDLKATRMFTQTVRDGIRLVVSLRNRQLDVLFELFPWLEWWFETEVERRVSERIQTGQGGIQQQLDTLRAEIAALKTAPPTATGPRPLAVPQIAAPVADDDDGLIVVKKAQSDGKSAANFINSAMALIQ